MDLEQKKSLILIIGLIFLFLGLFLFIYSYYHVIDCSPIDSWECYNRTDLSRLILAISSLIPLAIGYGIIKIGRGSINKKLKQIENEG